MKRASILITLAAAVMVGCNSTETKTTEVKDTTTAMASKDPAKEEASAPQADSATKAKAFMDYMMPGAMHKWMSAMNGSWTTEATMWEDEKKPPMTSKGTADFKMILGGRYLQCVHKSNMMGMPFEGISTMAYDNKKQMFVSTWIDNMGTGVWCIMGNYDTTTQTMTLSGKVVDPVTGKDMEIKEVTKVTDDKHQTMEMYVTPPGGKEFKNMEIKFTRK